MGFESDADGEKVLLVNGLSMKASEVEAKLDEGDIQEAESSLREGLALNYEIMIMATAKGGSPHGFTSNNLKFGAWSLI